MEDWEIIKLLLHIYQMKVELIILIFIFWNDVEKYFLLIDFDGNILEDFESLIIIKMMI